MDVIYKEELKFSGVTIPIILVLFVLIGSFGLAVIDRELIDPVEVIIGIVLILVFLFIYFNFYKLKLTVTTEFIEARFGMFARRISIADIIEAKVYKYDFAEFMGWGIRFNSKGMVAYNVNTDNYLGVLVKFNTTKKRNRILISSKNPEKVVEIINKLKESNA